MKIDWKSLIRIICFLIVLYACISNKIEAQQVGDRIEIKYTASSPSVQIICKLYRINYRDKNEKYIMHVETKEIGIIRFDGEGKVKESEENINVTMDIDKDFFEKVYTEIWKINLEKIVQENINIFGADGSNITIKYGSFQYFMSISVWCPRSTKGEVEKVDKIVLEVFRKANVAQWYK